MPSLLQKMIRPVRLFVGHVAARRFHLESHADKARAPDRKEVVQRSAFRAHLLEQNTGRGVNLPFLVSAPIAHATVGPVSEEPQLRPSSSVQISPCRQIYRVLSLDPVSGLPHLTEIPR